MPTARQSLVDELRVLSQVAPALSAPDLVAMHVAVDAAVRTLGKQVTHHPEMLPLLDHGLAALARLDRLVDERRGVVEATLQAEEATSEGAP